MTLLKLAEQKGWQVPSDGTPAAICIEFYRNCKATEKYPPFRYFIESMGASRFPTMEQAGKHFKTILSPQEFFERAATMPELEGISEDSKLMLKNIVIGNRQRQNEKRTA